MECLKHFQEAIVNVKSRLGLMKILSIKIFNSKNNVNGFIDELLI